MFNVGVRNCPFTWDNCLESIFHHRKMSWQAFFPFPLHSCKGLQCRPVISVYYSKYLFTSPITFSISLAPGWQLYQRKAAKWSFKNVFIESILWFKMRNFVSAASTCFLWIYTTALQVRSTWDCAQLPDTLQKFLFFSF